MGADAKYYLLAHYDESRRLVGCILFPFRAFVFS